MRSLLPDDPVLTTLFESLLTLLGTIQERSHAIAKDLARIARRDRTCRLMMTMPGVGALTAVSFVTTIEDPRRFRRSQAVGAYLGLTPPPLPIRRGRHQRPDLEVRGSPDPQASVRSGECHPVAHLPSARPEGMGRRDRPAIRLLESSRSVGTKALRYAASHVDRGASLRSKDNRLI